VIEPSGSLAALPDPLAVPWARRLSGELRPPPSKSLSHRYLALTLLLGDERRIDELLDAEDLHLFQDALRALGLGVEPAGSGVIVRGRVAPAGDEPRALFCGNAGTMFRFLTAALTAVPGRFLLDGTARLRERPIGPLVDALRALGARIEYQGVPGCAPLLIEGDTLEGGRCRLDAGESSQYLSALLMAGLRARRRVDIELAALTSAPYVALTRQTMRRLGVDRVAAVDGGLGVEPLPPGPARAVARVAVEPDYSAAAYPAAAAALVGGPVELLGLERDSAQGDRRFLDVLEQLGARVEWTSRGVRVSAGEHLRAAAHDFSDMPDQVPTLAALAAFADGITQIRGVAHLRIKESDRLAATTLGLRALGFIAKETPDGLIVHGRPELRREVSPPGPPAAVDTHGDHRIAMAFALVGLRRAGTRVLAPSVVGKSYPAFWRDLFGLITE
jgi:3-phosphoshikimate 1-carboxyvinyltransferase